MPPPPPHSAAAVTMCTPHLIARRSASGGHIRYHHEAAFATHGLVALLLLLLAICWGWLESGCPCMCVTIGAQKHTQQTLEEGGCVCLAGHGQRLQHFTAADMQCRTSKHKGKPL